MRLLTEFANTESRIALIDTTQRYSELDPYCYKPTCPNTSQAAVRGMARPVINVAMTTPPRLRTFATASDVTDAPTLAAEFHLHLLLNPAAILPTILPVASLESR